MNPNLPVGGSATDAIAAAGEGEPEKLTIFGFSFQHASFRKHLRGDSSVPASATEQLDASRFDLAVEHYFGSGISAALRIPVGTIRIRPSGGSSTTVAGFGDFEISGAYLLSRHWKGRSLPRVQLRAALLLPTGKNSRVTDPAGTVPPNLIAIGDGAIGLGGDVRLTQPIGAGVAGRASFGFRAPITYSETDLRFGWSVSYSLGGLYRLGEHLLLSADATGEHRNESESRVEGTLVNSGGNWLFGDLSATALVDERFAIGTSVRVPLYTRVNGTQIAQSWAVSTFLAVSFGGDDKEEKHEHSATERVPDVSVLAAGGDSFSLKDAAVSGKVVVIDFWAEWCEPCKEIEKELREYAARQSRLAVRKVEVPTFETPVALEHLEDVSALPVVWLLAPDGTLLRKLDGTNARAVKRALDDVFEL